jgi:serine/threonine protein kinase/Tol biopolymer transport system component
MPLAAGDRLGPYEIVAPLGAGGMGEVYRAKDPRLGRDVAIKVLPQHLSANPELRARFEREARTVSSLNHPNICTLHDIGREGDADYLVMELVEGETLADRIAKGPLPPDEALRIGIQIADALDRAHRAGIVHRDLKPGNVMLARSGAKLMDFGLARASILTGGNTSLTRSPTMTQPLTADGAIVGTFQYMAPEQLDGSEADARSDIWALGATLYEMVTGRRAFEGKSQASLIASILKEQPQPVSAVAPLAPPALDQVIRACLAKDPDQRIQTAHDVKLQLQWIAEGGSQAGVPAPVAARRRSREALAWALAGAALAAVIALGTLLVLRRPEPPRVMRFEVTPPPIAVSPTWPRLSPDGRILAFVAADSSGIPRIWIRPLDVLEAHPLQGTEGTGRPFWSPDSRYLAYVSTGRLRKVPVAGGPPVTLAETPNASDGTWGSHDVILFDGAATDSIRGVAAAGGDVRPYAYLDRKSKESSHGWPYFLPDGRHFLYVGYSGSQSSTGTIRVGTLGSRETRALGSTDGRVEYAQGYLVFPREGTLMAQRFDARSLRAIGDAVPVSENLNMGGASGNFSVSAAGTIAFASSNTRDQSQLVWYDRNGRRLGDAGPPAQYQDFSLSPDNTQLAMSLVDNTKGTQDIWVRQLASGITSRLTFDPNDEINPIWSPDGRRIAYASGGASLFRTFIRQASGVGDLDSLADMPNGHSGPASWAPDGRSILVRYLDANTSWDLYLIPLDRTQKPQRFVSTPFNENWGDFSPDGRWVAYTSSQSGRNEVYVQATDGSAGKWQVSGNGGTRAQWRSDGRELFFLGSDQTIMAVPIATGTSFKAGTPAPLFRIALLVGRYDGRRWEPSRDGQRFLVDQSLHAAGGSSFTVVTAWASEIAHR